MSAEKLDRAKKEVAADVDGMRVMTQQMVDQVFSFGELGYQEFETSKDLDRHPAEERLYDPDQTWPACRRRGPRPGDRASP